MCINVGGKKKPHRHHLPSDLCRTSRYLLLQDLICASVIYRQNLSLPFDHCRTSRFILLHYLISVSVFIDKTYLCPLTSVGPAYIYVYVGGDGAPLL